GDPAWNPPHRPHGEEDPPVTLPPRDEEDAPQGKARRMLWDPRAMNTLDSQTYLAAEYATQDALEACDQHDINRAVSLLSALVFRLDAPSRIGASRALVRDCATALEECIEARRSRSEDTEPAAPSATVLARLVRLLSVADPGQSIIVMQQIHRVLGRLDATID